MRRPVARNDIISVVEEKLVRFKEGGAELTSAALDVPTEFTSTAATECFNWMFLIIEVYAVVLHFDLFKEMYSTDMGMIDG